MKNNTTHEEGGRLAELKAVIAKEQTKERRKWIIRGIIILVVSTLIVLFKTAVQRTEQNAIQDAVQHQIERQLEEIRH